jgi:FkbM family methyltransferase
MSLKVFLDLGGHHGTATRLLQEPLSFDQEWEIHLYEPNPACELFDRMSKTDLSVTVHSSAIWIMDGTISFSQQNHRLAQNHSPTDGRSDIDGWGSRLSCLKTTHPSLLPPIEVPCVDLARILRSFSGSDYLAVKMDIEGAEFPVLRHLIREDVLSLIDVLYIEWHVRLLPDESMYSRQRLESQLREAGVKLQHWT